MLKRYNQAKKHAKANILFLLRDMSIDKNYGSILNFGLRWQGSKCTDNPIYQLFPYFLFWTFMSEIKYLPYFSFNR